MTSPAAAAAAAAAASASASVYKCGIQMLPLLRPPESDSAAISSTPKWPFSRRSTTTSPHSHFHSHSLSSTSSLASSLFSSFSSSDNESPPNLSTTLGPPTTGIPFSWEQLPGIPKKQIINSSNSSIEIFNSLPLPPPIPCDKFGYRKAKKKCTATTAGHGAGFRQDPFLAALVECSKEESSGWRSGKSSSSETERSAISSRPFALLANLNAYSCKRTCAVAESIVFVRRPRRLVYKHHQ